MTAPETSLLEWLLRPPRTWQMKWGERCALEGVLGLLNPGLSIEVGTAEGGSLDRLAAHSREVHSFDLTSEVQRLAPDFPNVTFHVGDSAVLLPAKLSDFERQGRHVDFALVDGDHSAEGARRDAEALLGSGACRRTVMLFHDASNEEVRAGLESVRFADHSKVALVILDFVPGYVVRHGPREGEIWNGLGLVVLDEDAPGAALEGDESWPAAEVNLRFRDALAGGGQPPAGSDGKGGRVRALEERLGRIEEALPALERSSGRLPATLRAAALRARTRIGR